MKITDERKTQNIKEKYKDRKIQTSDASYSERVTAKSFAGHLKSIFSV